MGDMMEKLTRFEKARLISARALQLSLGAPPFIKLTTDVPPEEIARAELEKQVLPMAVLRHMPSGEVKRIAVH